MTGFEKLPLEAGEYVIVNDNEYIEIKNYVTDRVKAKAQAVPSNLSYSMLLKPDIKPMYQYCVDKYGKKFWEVLYD